MDRQQPESLIIGKRKPSLEFQFQNKFRLGSELLPRPRNNVIIRGKMIGGVAGIGSLGGSVGGVGVGGNNNNNNRYKQRHQATRGNQHYSSYCDPCTDYLNSPMFHSLHTRWVVNCYKVIDCRQ